MDIDYGSGRHISAVSTDGDPTVVGYSFTTVIERVPERGLFSLVFHLEDGEWDTSEDQGNESPFTIHMTVLSGQVIRGGKLYGELDFITVPKGASMTSNATTGTVYMLLYKERLCGPHGVELRKAVLRGDILALQDLCREAIVMVKEEGDEVTFRPQLMATALQYLIRMAMRD